MNSNLLKIKFFLAPHYRRIRDFGYSCLSLLHARYKKNNILMFHMGRSGSTVLGDLLNQHADVSWKFEIFNDILYQIRYQNFAFNSSESYIAKRTERSRRFTNKKFVGFDIKLYDFEDLKTTAERFIQTAQSFGFDHFIVLERRNYLRCIVSQYRAEVNQKWHYLNSEKKKPNQSIHLDVNDLEIDKNRKSLNEHLTAYQQYFNAFQELVEKYNMLHLSYEMDIQDDPLIAYKKVCDFLHIDDKDVTIRLQKVSSRSLNETIENFAEVEAYLKDTEFEWMLHH